MTYKIIWAERYREESAIALEIQYRGKPFGLIIDFDRITRKETLSLWRIANEIIGRKISATAEDLESIRQDPATYTGFSYRNISNFLNKLK
jgi:hypothetical protein